MSGVYLPIEIPKNCFTDDCPCCDGENGRCRADKERRYVDGDRPYWCPLVALPDCGKLIDADAFIRNIAKLERVDPITAAGVIMFVNAAPAIIPADKEEENA